MNRKLSINPMRPVYDAHREARRRKFERYIGSLGPNPCNEIVLDRPEECVFGQETDDDSTIDFEWDD